ncbi:hypothetical protein QJS66_10490 [Kocuria rhizophila]|nr:hypothetical protein QJS66_10490 [Kocuria rhizophila]
MASLAVHYDLDAAQLPDLAGDDGVTGLIIGRAELLGWSQGFDRRAGTPGRGRSTR